MKKLLCCFLILVVFFILAACQNKSEAKPEVEYHISGFDGDKLYVDFDGNTLVYERYKAGIGSLKKKTMLGIFETNTAIEGIVWEVYSTEEYPDLSYILLISGTNSSWIFRISEQTP